MNDPKNFEEYICRLYDTNDVELAKKLFDEQDAEHLELYGTHIDGGDWD